MKKHLTDVEIKKIFTNPYALRKGIKVWKEAEKSGEEFIRYIKEKRKKSLEKVTG